MRSVDHIVSKFSKHLKKEEASGNNPAGQMLRHPNNLFRVASQKANEAFLNELTSNPREVKIAGVQELGNVASLSSFIKRDLGFQGKLGDRVLLTYGDTMFTDAQGSDEFRGMRCNSSAIACDNPTQVFDSVLDENNYPRELLQPSKEYGEDPSSYALGITNVIETSHGKGIVYFLLNHRPEGNNHLLGAGVAEVTIDETAGYPVPKASRLSRFWWDGENEPWYGDVCALRAGSYIYAYGHAKDNPWVYLSRVKSDSATDLNTYEYWNGETWQHERLKREEIGHKESVFWQVNQGQVFWSPYHQRFLFIFCDNFWSCQVLVKTSPAPEGPWSEPMTVHKPQPIQEGGNIYAAVPHPYFDNTGKTLIITYTNHPNTIQAIKVDFE